MSNNENPEFSLIEKAKKGDKSALTEIVTQNESMVYNTALRLCFAGNFFKGHTGITGF